MRHQNFGEGTWGIFQAHNGNKCYTSLKMAKDTKKQDNIVKHGQGTAKVPDILLSEIPVLDLAKKPKLDSKAKADIGSSEKLDTSPSEIRHYFDIRRKRRRIFPLAALVGFGSGLVASLFRYSLIHAETFRGKIIDFSHSFGFWGIIGPILFAIFGALSAFLITRKFAPEASGSGIPHLEAVLNRLRNLNWRRILPVKFLGGTLAIGGGMALGREGPTVQMGGAVGAAISEFLGISGRERLTLIAAGAGAGVAAAFNAPFSGLIFVLEEVRRDFQQVVFGSTFIACVVADITSRICFGQEKIFAIPDYATPDLKALPYFVILGIVTGFFGVLFNRYLMKSLDFFSAFKGKKLVFSVTVSGLIAGLAGWFSPDLPGMGHHLTESALKGNLVIKSIIIFLAIRFFLTIANYGTGVPGGIFAPLLTLGSLLGLLVGQGANYLSPETVPIPAVFGVVGMAALFTSIVRAPLTGIMLIVEMTGNYSLMLSLLASCIISYIVAEYLGELPIYEAMLQRDLRRAGLEMVLAEPAIMEFIIAHNARFAGKTIVELGLPPGCIIIRIFDGVREIVPKAHTQLLEDMKVTVLISPEASSALQMLKEGLEEGHSLIKS